MAGFHKAFRNVTTIESEDGSTFVFLGLMYIYIFIEKSFPGWKIANFGWQKLVNLHFCQFNRCFWLSNPHFCWQNHHYSSNNIRISRIDHIITSQQFWITMSIYFMIDHFRYKSHEITIILWFSHGFPTTTAPFSWGQTCLSVQRGVPRRVEFSALLEWRGLEDGRKL
jgi:hypothetical protein